MPTSLTPVQRHCSAKGCRSAAQWALQWNNPKLHDVQRRKTWLACDHHRATLAEFLTVRGFLRENVPVAELDEPERPDRGTPPIPS